MNFTIDELYQIAADVKNAIERGDRELLARLERYTDTTWPGFWPRIGEFA